MVKRTKMTPAIIHRIEHLLAPNRVTGIELNKRNPVEQPPREMQESVLPKFLRPASEKMR
ncbi:hypothetical protein BCD48_38205 [Pseudofrankia sp. BMG5.36]|nr:hypothetical protein BCD48_38205 [Pseudofrankia sp. BMG5.36]